MYNITLVSSIHSELGKCTPEEFYQIVAAINPDIIFEEICPNLFDILYNGKENPYDTLEVKTVKMHLRDHDIKHIPIDIEPDPNYTLQDTKYMFGNFKKFEAYMKLENEQNTMTENDGFAFLNSKRLMEIIEEKKLLELGLMNFLINRMQLSRIYNLFYEEHETRENKWLENIYNYSKVNSYNNALFYCGASHRKSLMQKIEDFEKKENFKLNWAFYSTNK